MQTLNRILWPVGALMLVVGILFDLPALMAVAVVVFIVAGCVAGVIVSARRYRQQHPPR